MKRPFIYLMALISLCLMKCSKSDLDKVNTDPTRAVGANYDFNNLLPTAELKCSNTGYTQLLYQSTMMQLLASTYYYYNNGDKYLNVANFTSYQGKIFEEGYTTASIIREMQRLATLKDPVANANIIAIGDIMFVMILQRITDTYGDVPYSQAAKAMQGVRYPVYDKQEDIYDFMLNDLQHAIGRLDEEKLRPTADLFYKGDISKWKKFGYSLMLRVAMRLTKINPDKARVWTEKAAGKTFSDVNDNLILLTDPASFTSQNSTSIALRTSSDYLEVRWSKTLIDQLRNTNDPRLGIIAEVPQDGLVKNSDQTLSGNSDPAIQMGLPNGFDLLNGAADIRKYPGYPGGTGSGSDIAPLGKYSRPKTSAYLKLGGLIFVMTYSETELLLAEAKTRGWNVPGTAAEHYANGITGALQSLAQMDPLMNISPQVISNYVAQHGLDESSIKNSLAEINTQYWITTGTCFNFIEAWLNWKRSGYPELTPVNYTGNVTGATIPRRMIYLSTEILNNPINYTEAVARLQGGDALTSRVWWDK